MTLLCMSNMPGVLQWRFPFAGVLIHPRFCIWVFFGGVRIAHLFSFLFVIYFFLRPLSSIKCCQFHFTVHFKLSLRFSLAFIYETIAYRSFLFLYLTGKLYIVVAHYGIFTSEISSPWNGWPLRMVNLHIKCQHLL